MFSPLALIRFLRAQLSVVLILLLCSSTAYAQSKNFFINKSEPAWIVRVLEKKAKPPSKDISNGYYLSLYENQNHLEQKEEFVHIIREIVSDAGVQNGSQISVTYAPDYQKLIFHKVIVWRNNVPYDQLVAKKFKILQTEKELSRFIYNGSYDAFLVLDDIRKGDQIEFSYSLKGDNPVFGNKFSSTFYFEGQSSISHMYTNLVFNKNRVLNLKKLNGAAAPRITEKDNLRLYEWEGTLTKTHRGVDFEPSWYNPLSRVQISEYKNWNEVVEWGLAINSYPDLKRPLLEKEIVELKSKSAGDKKKYIELATRFVQDEIRYMGIEIGAYSHKPNSPEQVLKQRYGDCKDKSLLLVQLLKGIDLNAYMAYVDTYLTEKTIEFLPSPFIFNHVIVVVDYENYKTWIDPTISYQRGSFDNFYAPDYGYALILRKGINSLEKIESNPAGKVVSELHFMVADTTENAMTSLVIKSTYSDNYADNMRAEIAEAGTDGLEKGFLEYYAKLYPEIETNEALKYVDDEKANTLEITESYNINNAWTHKGNDNKNLFFIYGDLINNELRNISINKRVAPLAIRNHVNIQQRIVLNMPYMANFGENSFKVENDKYYFELYQFQRDRVVTFDYTFRTMTSVIDADQLKAHISDSKKIEEYLTFQFDRSFGSIGNASGINFIMVAFFILAMAISVFFAFRFYHRQSEFDVEKIAYAQSIGGWLAILGLRVIYLPILILVSPFLSGIFKTVIWNNLAGFGESQQIVKGAFIVEVICYGTLLVYSVYCALLFFNRRSDFPKQFIIFSICHIGFVIFDLVTAFYISSISGQSAKAASEIPNLIWLVVFSAIWYLYLIKSERVKETFVFTHPKSEWQQALSEYYEDQFAVKPTQLNDENTSNKV